MNNDTERKEKRGGALEAITVNSLILAIILAAFLMLASVERGTLAKAASTSALSSEGAVYRGRRRDAVGLIIKLDWNTSRLDEILDSLEKNGARATFALTEGVIKENGGAAERILAGGHELAVMCAEDDPAEREIRNAYAAGDIVSGGRVSFYYCGRTAKNAEKRAARKLGVLPVVGSVDLVSERGGEDELLEKARSFVRGGDIVVLSPSEAMIRALPRMLEYFFSADLTATTVGGIIYD